MATAGTTVEARARLPAVPPRQPTNEPTSGTARWVRGGAVGLTAMGLAMAGHTVAGGGLPAAGPLATLATAAVLGSVGLSGRRWTLGLLLGVLLTVQGAFHVAFGDLIGAGPGQAAVHLHTGVAAHVTAAHPLGWRMVSAHLVAALLTALILRRGEACCWRLVALAAAPLRAARLLAARAPLPSVGPSARVERGPMFRQVRLLVLSQARRGPPPAPAV